MFKALVIDRPDPDENEVVVEIRQLEVDNLPEGDVLVDVAYSSINYKDALAITNKGKIARSFPMVPGIDLAGTVSGSTSGRFNPGDQVLLTGWGVGEKHWGGLAQKARLHSDWLIPMPAGLDAEKAMILGTAGLTAMLCVMRLQEAGVKPEHGKVVVTGAAGGVGSVAVLLLAQLGYHVVAVTGRSRTHSYLSELGAKEFIDRDDMTEVGPPLRSQKWAGAIDVVGGSILANVLTEMEYGGVVVACGLAQSHVLNTTVMPFILRSVSLLGVDSVLCPVERRQIAWQRLAKEIPEKAYAQIGQVVPLEEAKEVAEQIVDGKVQGRILISLGTPAEQTAPAPSADAPSANESA